MVMTVMLILVAVPSVGTWIIDSRVRGGADALQSALRTAQMTALSRSRGTVLALTAATPAWDAAPLANAARWYVRVQPLIGSGEVADSGDFIVGTDVADRLGITLQGPALVCFNSLGQLVSKTAVETGLGIGCSAPSDDSTTPTDYTLSKLGGSRSLKVRVYLGGRVRVCDTSKTLSSEHPDGC